MKRPREILLERHRDRQPVLDRLRREVVRDLARVPAGSEAASHSEREGSGGLWAWLARWWGWAALAAVWTVIVVLQASMPSLGSETPPQQTAVTAPEMRDQLRQQQALRMELLREGEARTEQLEDRRPQEDPDSFGRSQSVGAVHYADAGREVNPNSTQEENRYAQV